MKVLIDHSSPFLLAHGGFQIQIEKTSQALTELGVDVEYIRWWDGTQKGDLIHFFGEPRTDYLRRARAINLPVVLTILMSETCNRSDHRLKMQGAIVRTLLKSPIGHGILDQLKWKAFLENDRIIVGLAAEKKALKAIYGLSDSQIRIVPLGLSETYLHAGPPTRCEPHLICTGTITAVKNSLELAKLAHRAQVPIQFVGKPYHLEDAYWKTFQSQIDGTIVKYVTHVSNESEMIHLLQRARGFVLMSDYENWCLSAHEAVACGLPILVPDQKWSRERFGEKAHYFHGRGRTENSKAIKDFYDRCPQLKAPDIKLFSWHEVARSLIEVYSEVLHL
ncbi:MAG: glycosyltransferase [Verrucomicrobiota bacterium]|nr:glycosyltransferase [Verrucomicrobiota bacterium]